MADKKRVASVVPSNSVLSLCSDQSDLMATVGEKTVKIVGKGHASCFERLLQEWYEEELFIDVTLLCSGAHHRDGKVPQDPEEETTSDASRNAGTVRGLNEVKLSCNRSVLAAASPVFASLFTQHIGEDDLTVSLAGYSPPALKAVVEYVYRGTLVFNNTEREEISAILRDFQIHVPEETASSLIDNADDTNHVPATLQTKFVLVESTPQQDETSSATPITSQVSIDNQLPTLPRSSARKSLQTPRKSPKIDQKNAGSSHRVLKKILPGPAPKGASSLALPTSLVRPYGLQKAVPAPGSTTTVALSPAKHQTGRGAKRKKVPVVIDAPVTDGKDLLVDIPLLRFKLPPRVSVEKKACLEWTLPAAKSILKETDSQNSLKKTTRVFVSALIDVPGIFSTYKDKKPIPLDFPYACPPVEVVSHVNAPSFFTRTPSRTYSRSQKSGHIPRLSFGGLKSENIDTVSQVGRKVHITTRGTAVLNAQSSALYEDLPATAVSNHMALSRLNLEHNYSFGETTSTVDEENANIGEGSEDMEDYKRALQLAINEQRRQNRLKQRLASINKEIGILKSRAARLLTFCHEDPEAHVMQPEPERPPPEPKAPLPMVECDICHKMVKESWLKRHKQVQHSTSRPHLCEECGRTFVLRAQLRTHQHRQHAPRTANHLCSVCGRAFRFAHYLRRHMSMHAAEKPYSCKYCDKSFRLRPVLIKHIRTHTGEKPYKCEVCGRCFTQRTTYANHAKLHTKWREMGLTEAESEKQRPSRRLQCEFCSMTFRLELFLNLHRSKHTGEIPQLPCPTCKETHPSIKELNQHRKTQHPETVYFCQLCPKSFTNKPNFDFHMEKHSNPNATKKKYPSNLNQAGPCTCEFCGKELKSRFALDYHIKGVHLGDRPFKCTYCTKRFAQKPSLDQHLRTHTGERPYKCNQCPSAFKQGQHLTAHMVLHTGERPFKCEYCPKSFPHKTTLYAHLRIHRNTRWSCQYCRKVLPSGAQLQRHEEVCVQRSMAETEQQ